MYQPQLGDLFTVYNRDITEGIVEFGGLLEPVQQGKDPSKHVYDRENGLASA